MFFVFAGIMWAQGKLQILATVAGALLLFQTVYLVSLFVYKLRQIIKEAKTDGKSTSTHKMMTVMRKTSLLAFISTLNILFSSIANVILGRFESEHSYFGFALVIVADMETSFLCIILAYSYFKNYYAALCGCCEKCFLSCCCRCIGYNDELQNDTKSNITIEGQSVTDATKTTSTEMTSEQKESV